MKTRIIAIALASVLLLGGGSAFALTMNESNNATPIIANVTCTDNEAKVEQIVEPVEEFVVERIEEFVDENLGNYSLDELLVLIEAEREVQRVAHELAEHARTLTWPEGADAIQDAKTTWWNAQTKIDVYRAQYDKLYEEQGLARWDAKKAEYPAATEIWLYMKSLGWNDYVCAGIMGNIMSEVGGGTLNLQTTLYSYGNKYYYGICQWNKSAYGEIHGADLATQLVFLKDTIKREMDTFGYAFKKGFTLDSFLELTNERDAALAFAKCYERCSKSSYSARQSNATTAYNYFVNN